MKLKLIAVLYKMTPIGFIVQYSNEDDYTVYHGFMKLHRQFSQALEYAQELYRGFLESRGEDYQGPFQPYRPSKKDCENQGSVLVFESPEYVVWIDCVVE